MYRLLLPALALAVSSACIVYDEDVYYEGEGLEAPAPHDASSDTDAPVSMDDALEEEADAPPALYFDPPFAAAGDVVIITLWSDDDEISVNDIAKIEFFGGADVTVLTSAPRGPSELLITVQVEAQAYPGDLDVLVQLHDGSVVFLDGGFEVIDAGDGAGSPVSGPGSGGDAADEGDCTCP